MPKTTILSPTEGGAIKVTGSVIWLPLGDTKLKAFIQDEPRYLLDYRSGMVIPNVHRTDGTLNDVRIFLLATSHPGMQLSDRMVAKRQWADIVALKGVDRIIAALEKAPSLND